MSIPKSCGIREKEREDIKQMNNVSSFDEEETTGIGKFDLTDLTPTQENTHILTRIEILEILMLGISA